MFVDVLVDMYLRYLFWLMNMEEWSINDWLPV